MRVFPLHMHWLQHERELRSNVPIFPFASVCQSTLSSTDFLPPHSGALPKCEGWPFPAPEGLPNLPAESLHSVIVASLHVRDAHTQDRLVHAFALVQDLFHKGELGRGLGGYVRRKRW